MSSIPLKRVIRNGRVEVDDPIDLPDGTGVFVTIGTDIPGDAGASLPEDVAHRAATERLKSFDLMTEDEQNDDPVVVQRWIDDLRSIPAVPENPVQEAEWRAWEEKMRVFNLDAVRKQFEEGMP